MPNFLVVSYFGQISELEENFNGFVDPTLQRITDLSHYLGPHLDFFFLYSSDVDLAS